MMGEKAMAARVAIFLPSIFRAFHESGMDEPYQRSCCPPPALAPGYSPAPFCRKSWRGACPNLSTRNADVIVAAIPNDTDVWMAVPASPPFRLTIRARLDNGCEECRLPVYRCESEAGQMLHLCASHLQLRCR
jgi:hypothetical protein